jgi:hypothetical protein
MVSAHVELRGIRAGDPEIGQLAELSENNPAPADP